MLPDIPEFHFCHLMLEEQGPFVKVDIFSSHYCNDSD